MLFTCYASPEGGKMATELTARLRACEGDTLTMHERGGTAIFQLQMAITFLFLVRFQKFFFCRIQLVKLYAYSYTNITDIQVGKSALFRAPPKQAKVRPCTQKRQN